MVSMVEQELDKELKYIILRYLEVYKTNALRLEIHARRDCKPTSVVVTITNSRRI